MKTRPINLTADEVRAVIDGRMTQLRRPVNLSKPCLHLSRTVRPDWPFGDYPTATPGRYAATMNQYGAVCAVVGDRELGLRPGEFDFVCPYAKGHTSLVGRDINARWTILPSKPQRLWVREAWTSLAYGPRYGCEIHYQADGHDPERDWDARVANRRIVDYTPGAPVETLGYRPLKLGPWRSSATMPRWASRLTLDVIAVRVERVQSITEADARATGAVDDATMLRALSHVRGAAAVAAVPSRLLSARDNFAAAWDARFGKTAPWASNHWTWVVDVKRVEGERC